MTLLAVGSVAFDSIRTPHGQVDDIVGGSATYFSVTASCFTPVRIVAVIGEDFGEEQLRVDPHAVRPRLPRPWTLVDERLDVHRHPLSVCHPV